MEYIMNDSELKQEVLNLAYAIGDQDGLEFSTVMYISSELNIPFKKVQVILNESLFDME
jgi:hypothetical protein